jgi:hypothetical protein
MTSLEPTTSAIKTAAAENQYYQDYDQKCVCVHDALLWICETHELSTITSASALEEVERSASEFTEINARKS